MKKFMTLFVILGMMTVISCNQAAKQKKHAGTGQEEMVPETLVNTLTEEEKAEGWMLLFDGKTTRGWKNFNEDTLTGWAVEDECLVALGLGGDIGGDIVTEHEFGNFILSWEWKLGPHGNSGVMYHVQEGPQYKAAYETGPEYQLIDDDDYWENGAPCPIEEWQKTGADYAMYVPPEDKVLHVRDWNSSRIVFTREKVEYWLNGAKTVEFVPWSDDWYYRRSSEKWDAYPDYGLARSGRICLQDHGSKIWFRNIKIRELP
jgi:hypothetical protein